MSCEQPCACFAAISISATNSYSWRIRSGFVWENWREGIEQHLSRPAFQQASAALAPDLDGSFNDLRAWLPARVAPNQGAD
jgi:hypothetical protein